MCSEVFPHQKRDVFEPAGAKRNATQKQLGDFIGKSIKGIHQDNNQAACLKNSLSGCIKITIK